MENSVNRSKPLPPLMGWISLFLVFSILLLNATLVSEKTAKDDGPALRQLELSIIGATASSILSGQAMNEKALSQAVSKANEIPPSVRKSRLVAAAELFEGKPIDAATRKWLRDSKLASDQNIAKFAEAKPPQKSVLLKSLGTSTRTDRIVKSAMAFSIGDTSTAKENLLNDALRLTGSGLLLVGTLGLGCVAIITLIIQKLSVGIRPLGFALPISDKLGANHGAARAALMLFAYVLPGLAPASLRGLAFLIFGVSMVAAVMVPIGGKKFSLRDVIGDTARPLHLAGIGLLVFFAEVVLLMTYLLAFQAIHTGPQPTHPGAERLLENPNPLMIIAFGLQAVVMAPMLEELLFRGLIAPSIARISRPWIGIVVSGCMFAMIHPQGFLAWVPLALFGMIAATVAYTTKSLIPGMVMHACHNLFLTLLLVLVS